MSTSEGGRNWAMSGGQAYADDAPLKYAPSGGHAASTSTSYQGDYSNQHNAPYRWTPCPEWEQTGRCKYNETCYRRHGPEDQRIVPQGWEKKRSNRSSSTSSHGSSHSGSAASTGAYSNGGGQGMGNQHSPHISSSQPQQGQWIPRHGQTAPRPAAPNPTKYTSGTMGGAIYQQHPALPHHGPGLSGHSGIGGPHYQIHSNQQTSNSSSAIDSMGLSLSRVSVGSPDAYDSDPATSPTVLSPGVLSPTITSPSMSHRMSLSSSPRDSFDSHPVQVVEKPWIWQPCRHWQDSGSCRYGDSCKYRHGPEDRRERPAPRPTAHASAHALMRSNSNSSMESLGTFSTADSLVTSRPNISLQPIGAQITSPNASMGTLPPFHGGNSLSGSHVSLPGSGNPIWDLFSPAAGRLSPPLGEDSAVIMQAFGEHLRNVCIHHPDSADLQSELNSIHIQAMITIQLQRENFLPPSIQDSMRVLLQSIAISSNPHEWQFALVKVLDFLNALLDHLFNKFVSVSISSPSSSFGTLPVDIPSKLSLVQPYIGGRLSGSISELYDLGSRASAGLFAPTQEEVITILEQLRRVAASTSKSV